MALNAPAVENIIGLGCDIEVDAADYSSNELQGFVRKLAADQTLKITNASTLTAAHIEGIVQVASIRTNIVISF